MTSHAYLVSPDGVSTLHHIIAIEGQDGTGKESVSKRLVELLREKEFRAEMVSFPRYDTPVGKVIEAYQRGSFGDPTEIDPFIGGALYTLDRKNFFMTDGEALVQNNDFLIMDRSYFSNFIYQCTKLFYASNSERKRMKHWMTSALKAELEDNGIDEFILYRVYYLTISEEDRQEQMKSRNLLDMNESSDWYQMGLRSFFQETRCYDFWKNLGFDPKLEEFYYRKVKKIEVVHSKSMEGIPEAVDATARKIMDDINTNFIAPRVVKRLTGGPQ